MTNDMNIRISQELDGVMFSLNTQIQRAIDNVKFNQLISQSQSAVNAFCNRLRYRKQEPKAVNSWKAVELEKYCL